MPLLLVALMTCLALGPAAPAAVAATRGALSTAGAMSTAGALSTAGAMSTAGVAAGALSTAPAICRATGSRATVVFTPSARTGQAINTAIDAAAARPDGGIVRLATGQYLTSVPIVVKSNVMLRGAGTSATTVKAASDFMDSGGPNGGHPLITTDGGTNMTIAALTADQSGDTLNGNVPDRLAAYLVDVRDSTNVVVAGVRTRNPFTYSIAVVGSTNFCVRNSRTSVASSGRYDQLDGIHVLDSATGDVLNNLVDQRIGTDGDDGLVAHTIHGPVHDVRFIGNRVRGGNNGDGMQLAVGNFPVYDLTISDNEFYDSPFGVRTGYYDRGTGAVYDIALNGNYVHDLRGGHAFPTGGNAIDIGDFGANGPVSNVTATNNRACRAGTVIVVAGPGNVVSGTTAC